MSPPVTAARPMKLADLDVLGADPPLAAAEALDAVDAQDVRADALDLARRARRGSGRGPGRAARRRRCRCTVSPAASDGGHDRVLGRHHARLVEEDVRAAEAVGAQLVARADVDLGAELGEGVDVRVEAAAADHVAAGRRHARRARSARAAARRAGTRRGSRLRELRVELGRRDVRRVDADLVRARSTRRRRRGRRAARASSRRRGCAARSCSTTGSVVSRHAARIGSAAFLLPGGADPCR